MGPEALFVAAAGGRDGFWYEGTTFSAPLREKRMAFARGRLASHTCKIEEIAARSGYTELSAFYRAFKRQFGYAPGTVRHPGSGDRTAS